MICFEHAGTVFLEKWLLPVYVAYDNLIQRGLTYPRTFYFPSIGEYAPLLEKHGLQVRYAVLFDRPTAQSTKDGLADWINMFVKTPFQGMDAGTKEQILAETRELLRDRLYVDGKWVIDYVRIRMKAVKL